MESVPVALEEEGSLISKSSLLQLHVLSRFPAHHHQCQMKRADKNHLNNMEVSITLQSILMSPCQYLQAVNLTKRCSTIQQSSHASDTLPVELL